MHRLPIRPRALTQSAFTPNTPGAQDVILADNDQFQFIVIGFEKDDMNYQYMKVFINNKTDKTLMFSAENVAINGYMCDPYWAMSVAPGKMAMGRFSWSDADLSANGIESIEEVEFHSLFSY